MQLAGLHVPKMQETPEQKLNLISSQLYQWSVYFT